MSNKPYLEVNTLVTLKEFFSRSGCHFINLLKCLTLFSFNVKDNNIFPCLHTIRLYYNIQKCVRALQIRIHMASSNSKHRSFPPKRKERL